MAMRPLIAPDHYQFIDGPEARAYDEGRLYGRWEADNALNWHTTCVNCGHLLDQLYGEFSKGERSGMANAARLLREQASTAAVTIYDRDQAIATAKVLREVGDALEKLAQVK